MKNTMSIKFTKVMAAALTAAVITISTGAVSASAATDETAFDTKFLNDMDVCPDRWGNLYTDFHWGKVSGAADSSWAKTDVRSVTCYISMNHYYISGKEVTREEAYEYAAQKLGKTYIKDKYFPKPANNDQKRHKKKLINNIVGR